MELWQQSLLQTVFPAPWITAIILMTMEYQRELIWEHPGQMEIHISITQVKSMKSASMRGLYYQEKSLHYMKGENTQRQNQLSGLRKDS